MRLTAITALLLMLSGCQMAGPDYVRPTTALPSQWDTTSNNTVIPVDWWSDFNDRALTTLIQRALNSNLDLQIATSRIEQSRALLGVTEAKMLPNFNLNTAYQRNRASGVGLMDPSGNQGKEDYDTGIAGIGTSWEIDLWGKLQRASESDRAHLAATEESRRAMQIVVASDISMYYFRLIYSQQLKKNAEEQYAITVKKKYLAEAKYLHGAGDQRDIEQAQIKKEKEKEKVTLAEIDDQQERVRNAIALLLGENPIQLKNYLPKIDISPKIPRDIPLGLPSELALRRPDIREAGELLHQATADVGVAQADYYPRITLMGNAGYQALALSDMGSWASRTFSFGPVLYLPIFDGGKITRQVRFHEHKQQEMVFNYQLTVLRAWNEVDNALSNYRMQQKKYLFSKTALTAGEQDFTLVLNSYSMGVSNYIDVLNAQSVILSLKHSHIFSQQESVLAAIQLYRTLGGGWQNTYPVKNNIKGSS